MHSILHSSPHMPIRTTKGMPHAGANTQTNQNQTRASRVFSSQRVGKRQERTRRYIPLRIPLVIPNLSIPLVVPNQSIPLIIPNQSIPLVVLNLSIPLVVQMANPTTKGKTMLGKTMLISLPVRYPI